jgi:hypothetical protein
MRVTLESTSKFILLNGIPARVWEGKSDNGISCYAFITRIAVARKDDSGEFERDLQEHRVPCAEVAGFPFRLVL